MNTLRVLVLAAGLLVATQAGADADREAAYKEVCVGKVDINSPGEDQMMCAILRLQIQVESLRLDVLRLSILTGYSKHMKLKK